MGRGGGPPVKEIFLKKNIFLVLPLYSMRAGLFINDVITGLRGRTNKKKGGGSTNFLENVHELG